MLTLVFSQVFYINRLVQAQTDSATLLQLNNQLLQLRRHEKDFMLRLNPTYAERFKDRTAKLESELTKLESIFDSYSLPAEQLTAIRSSFSRYTQEFTRLVELQTAIGMDESSGQQGEFRRNIHTLEQALEDKGLDSLSLLMLQLRRHEKDFLQRLDLAYADKGQQTYGELRDSLLSSSLADKVTVLDSYQSGFTEIVASYQDIGLSPELGVQGEFREAAHRLESQLVELGKTVNPLIAKREQDVKVNGFVITIFTAFVLLSLLVRNFVRLQKALSSFLLFFHQSKRSYAPLDVKKMGFAEFETLATVANEMVDSRRGMEAELKKAKDRVTELQTRTRKNT